MIKYVDTNILIRIITNDVPELARAAITLTKQGSRGELIILDVVLVELFFILEANRQYRYTRKQSKLAFESILDTAQFKITERAKEAFELFAKNPKLDFTDCLLLVHAGQRTKNLLSFDKDLLNLAKS